MYEVCKRIEVAGSHYLNLDYDSPCEKLHGHNWIITVTVRGSQLNHNGMLIDFKHIKRVVSQLDHANLNDIISSNAYGNPTAENISKWVAERVQDEITSRFHDNDIFEEIDIPQVVKVTVQESEGNLACYIP